MIIAVIQDSDCSTIEKKLLEGEFRLTKLPSTGGFFKEGSTTFLIGVKDNQVKETLSLIQENCKVRDVNLKPNTPLGWSTEAFIPYPIEHTVGGATVFVLPIDSFYQY